MVKSFEDAFTDLQSEFVSLCMEYTNGNVDKIYIYIYQDASYRYDNYTTSGISPVSELMSWYGEIKGKVEQ